jgi:hypothetical protein
MTNFFMHFILFHVCFPSHSSTWSISEGGFPALIIASEHAMWHTHLNNPLQSIKCYMESPISANVLTGIQDSFGDRIPMIAAAMHPEGTLSPYEIEVADPLTDIVVNNLLRMPMDFSYYTNLLTSSPIARDKQPLKGNAKMQQWITKISKSILTRLK